MLVTPIEDKSGILESSGRMNGRLMSNTGNREPKKLNSNSGSTSDSSSVSSDMGSTADPASTEFARPPRGPGGAPPAGACGLVGSLFSSGCRGRAEAFARRLHRRLTSLGAAANTTDSASDTIANDNVLPATSDTQHHSGSDSSGMVLRRQPRRSPESDLYYDLVGELELENGATSPPEEVTAAELADLLVNTEILKINHHDACHCLPNAPRLQLENDSESDFVSPLSETSADSEGGAELYFDPESSDTDKTNGELYFEVANTSDSESSSKPQNSSSIGAVPTVIIKCDDSSDSSVSVPPDIVDTKRREKQRPKIRPLQCSSEESAESTSPSHESLWSSFEDDSTLSLRDDSPLGTMRNLDLDEVDFVIQAATEKDKLAEVVSQENEEQRKSSDGNSTATLLEVEEAPSEDHSTYSSTLDIPGALTAEYPTGARVKEMSLKNEVRLRIENGAVLQEHSNEVVKNDEHLSPKINDKRTTTERKKEDGEVEEEEEEEEKEEEKEEKEEEEEEEERPQRVRRCSSLKSGKTPPGTPGRKKIVRFADVLGLDLADVRTFLDEIPKVPNSAYSDLIYDDTFQKESSPVNPNAWETRYVDRRGSLSNALLRKQMDRLLVPLFQQPGGLPSFLDTVRDRKVCLENVVVEDPVSLCVRGTVRVLNIDFHKSVHVRYTLNSWKNFSDLHTTYVSNSCDGFSDKFSFVLYCHTLAVGQRLEFAIRFQCKGSQYWDNNCGANYCFQCLPNSSNVEYPSITARESTTRDWSPMFY